MKTLKTRWIEIVASLWLIIIAVHFFGRYPVPMSAETDPPFAYLGMLVLIIATLVIRAFSAVRSRTEDQ